MASMPEDNTQLGLYVYTYRLNLQPIALLSQIEVVKRAKSLKVKKELFERLINIVIFFMLSL